MTGASLRPATPADLPALIAAADAVFRAGQRRSMGQDYPLLFGEENAPNLFLVEQNGVVIAHAGVVLRPVVVRGRVWQAACFGAVFTTPAARGAGWATLVFGRAVSHAREHGAELGLVSGARGLYARAGFSPLPPALRFRAHAQGPASPGYAVDAFTPGDLPAIARLYEEEPIRFVRSPDDWRRLLAAGVAFYDPATLYVVRRQGPVVAYAVLGERAGLDPGTPRDRIVEVAGDRSALAAALPLLLDRRRTTQVDLVGPAHDQDLAATARAQGWTRGQAPFPFSIAWFGAPPGATAFTAAPWYGLNYV